MTRHVLLLDLVDDAALIAAYRDAHRPGGVPAAVLAEIRASGILDMEIWQVGDRLVMIMTTDATYDPTARSARLATDPALRMWEDAMSRLQRPLPAASSGVKWIEAARIFDLGEHA